ncbi:MAG TPA: DUF3341 domain-containing protein, partial [candidate division Zixibacteria bacterium]|nr:DUF3341 domain-containing protein [candidate division Zixibacteria bacterium]
MAERARKAYGVLAEFRSTGDLLRAAEKLRDAGFRRWDVHSPFPIHGMDRAMGLGRSPVGFIVGLCGTTGLLVFLAFLYWINVYDYPMVISGKPHFSYQAFVPPLFAITILSSALAALFGMLALNRLPRLHHPLFSSPQFEKVTGGGFFISVEADDPKFAEIERTGLLEALGAT